MVEETKTVAKAAIKSVSVTPIKAGVETQQKADNLNESRKKEVIDHNDNNLQVIIDKPRSADVLCGRGKEAFEHIGNDCFRLLIARYADTYQEAPTKKAKSQLILKIVDIVNSRGGRFLMRRNSMMTTTTSNSKNVDTANTTPIKIASSNICDVDNNSNNRNNEDEEGWIDGGIKMGKKKTGYALRDAVRGRVKCIFEKAPSMKEIHDPYDYNHQERVFRPLKVEDNSKAVQTHCNTNTLWRPQHQRMISYDEEESNKSPFKRRRDDDNRNYYRSPENFNNRYSHHYHHQYFRGEPPFMMGRGNLHRYQPHQYQHPNDEMGSMRISMIPDKHKSNVTLKRKITPSKTEDEPEKDWRNFRELDNEVANDLMIFFSDDRDDNKSSNRSSSARNEYYHNNKEETNQLSEDNNKIHQNNSKDEAKQDDQHNDDDGKSNNNNNVVKYEEVKSNNSNSNSSSSSRNHNDNGENHFCDRITITPPPYQHYFYPNNDISPYNHHHQCNFSFTKNDQEIYQLGQICRGT